MSQAEVFTSIIWTPLCLSHRAFAVHTLDQDVWPQHNPTTISVHHTLLALKLRAPGVTNRSGEWQTTRVSRMQPVAMEIQASFLNICVAQGNITSSHCEKSLLRVPWRVGFVSHNCSLLSNPIMCSGRKWLDHSLTEDRWRQGVLSNRWACNQGHEFLIQNLCRKNSNLKKSIGRDPFSLLCHRTTPGNTTQK